MSCGRNKMDPASEIEKVLQKGNVSWFEFLFDTTGDLLKKHLGDASSEPSAPQLIVQFLEHSGLLSINLGGASEAPPSENKRAQRLCRLALRVAAYLQWNLEFLEENLSLQWQDFLLGELMKTDPSLEGVQLTEVELSKLDQKTAMTLVIYYRWVVRTLAQHFLPYLTKTSNNGMSADNLANENILRKLEEQLPTAVHILEQALKVTEDMELPGAPSLLQESKKKQDQDQEKKEASSETPAENEGHDQSMEDKDAGENKAESERSIKNGTEECNGCSSSTTENMETCAEEVSKVKMDDIVAQVSFDLGTLYFYQEKFEQATTMFQSCKTAKCPKSAFFTVDEKKLEGYCMACSGLSKVPSLSSSATLETSESSLMMKLEHCINSGYKDLVQLLVEDNVTCELPLEFRDNLVAELRTHKKMEDEEEEDSEGVALDWQVMVCNTIREVLEGRPVTPVFWVELKTCSQNQLENIFSLCFQSVPVAEESPPETVKNSSRFKVLRSFVQLICCHCEQMNGWEIARNSRARIFLVDEEEMLEEAQDEATKTEQEATKWIPVDILGNREVLLGQESPEVKKGLLCNKLRHTVDPDEISTIVEQLHQLEKGKRQSEEFMCLLYKSHLEEIKNLQQQDILHIIFSKAMQCSALQEYNKVSQLLSYALGMVNSVAGRGPSGGPMERVKSAIHQELLVLDICQDSNMKRSDELSNRVKSYIWQTAPGAAELHVEEQVTVFLLNGREWEFLSDVKFDENAQSLDHRSLSSLLASTCYFLPKPQGWRKPARSLWDGMLKVFSNTGQQKRPADGGQGVMVTRATDGIKLSNLIKFVRKIKEETALTVLISCLVRLHNVSNKDNESDNRGELSSSHSHLWPTTITNPGNVNFNHVGLALSGVVHHAISVQHHNASWLQTLGNIYLDSGNYSSALRCYLEAGAVSSSFFNSPVPSTVWDDQVYRKMVTCCSAMKAHIQSALLCQCMEVKDYTTAFKALQQASLASSDAMDLYYPFFWDMTMLEYLGYIHAKRGQNDKKQLAVQAISQPELNIFNSSELLQHTEQSRKAKLFRTLAKQYL